MNPFREHMKETQGTIGWCSCHSFKDGRIKIADNDGIITGCQIDGKEHDEFCSYSNAYIGLSELARMLNSDYDLYEGWSDHHIIIQEENEILPCCECPWFMDCSAMEQD